MLVAELVRVEKAMADALATIETYKRELPKLRRALAAYRGRAMHSAPSITSGEGIVRRTGVSAAVRVRMARDGRVVLAEVAREMEHLYPNYMAAYRSVSSCMRHFPYYRTAPGVYGPSPATSPANEHTS